MADKREQRRAKRLEKKKKKRSNVSRPARDGGSASTPSFKAALGWPPGDCFLTAGWDDPGASLHAVFARSHDDGRTVAAFVEIDRSGPGVVSSRVVTVPTSEMVLGECMRMSEASGELAFQGAPPSVVAGVLRDAALNGENDPDESFSRVESLIDDVDADRLDTPFGPDTAPKRKPGLLDRLFQWLG